MIITLISTKIKMLVFRLFFLTFSVTMMLFSMNHTVWILYDDAFPKEGFSKRFWCYTISESECAKILPDCLDSRIQFGKISKKVGIWWRMMETICIDDNMLLKSLRCCWPIRDLGGLFSLKKSPTISKNHVLKTEVNRH